MSLQHFKIIGNGISLYEPECENGGDKRQRTATPAPALIIMCTWLGGATDKRIQRYTQGYHRLWPTSSILLIRTTNAEYAFWSAKSLRRKLRPAIHAIRRISGRSTAAALSFTTNSRAFSSSSAVLPPAAAVMAPPRTLLHIFSNGGAYVATQLITSMNTILSSLGQTSQLPLRQIVFDSCPGAMTVDRGYQAAARALPPSPLRPLGRAALYLAVLGIVGSETIGFRPSLCETVAAQINNPDVCDPTAIRVYLSSTSDDIVYTDEVLAHRDEASVRGLRTETVVFERAAHCALIREDESVYWGTIASAWEKRAEFDHKTVDNLSPPPPSSSYPSHFTPTARKEGDGGRRISRNEGHPLRQVLLRSRL